MPAPDQILTVAQMQAAEQALIDTGTSVDALMQRAGKGAADFVWRLAAGRAVTVLCGPGNNGGDGYVIAEVLRRRGGDVRLVAPLAPSTDAARTARDLCQVGISGSAGHARGGVFVDCLFGSGLSRALSGNLAEELRVLASHHAQAVAIDLPSGIESDSGNLLNDDLPNYDLTVALGGWKHAHWRLPARSKLGELRLVDIGVDAVPDAARLISKPRLDAPAADAHKYTRGLLAVVGGAMPGAALLACEAAMRAGAGYVKLLSRRSHPALPAALVHADGDLAEMLADDRIDTICIGPGLGRDSDAKASLRLALASDCTFLLDADALVLLEPSMLQDGARVVATPHDGELAMLCETFGIDAGRRSERTRELARVSGMTVAAKGPDTLVAAPCGRLALAPPAPSWLSVAGSGDVLAGVLASRLAVGAEPFDAACQAIWLHGEAARLCRAPFTPDELARAVPNAVAATL